MIAGLLWVGGCGEDAPPTTPSASETPETPVPPPIARPTTQQILEAPRKPLQMQVIPFTIDAPDLWKVVDIKNPAGLATMIEAPIIDDEARVSLSKRDPMGGETLRNFLDRIQKDDADARKVGGSVTVRQVGDLRIVDSRRPSGDSSQPDSERGFEWRITLFYPSGIAHDQFAMQFIGLTVASYQKNKELLDEVIKTIRYDDGLPLSRPRP
jgi:hypothetical protein